MENVKTYLYDASGRDEELSFDEIDPGQIAKNQLLWVNVLKRDEHLLNEVTSKLQVKNVPCKTVLDDTGRPDVGRFETFFRFCVASVVTKKDSSPERLMVDYIVGKNFVVTVHDGEVDHFDEFRGREKGETQFGDLDAESFVATLLDLNLVSYFHAIDELERRVEETDERILKKDIETEEFLQDMVGLRRDVAKLRRWLTPHREVFYALSRADFQQIAKSDSAEQYRTLNQHFESAVDAVENSRESVLGVFDLYATKSSQMTNTFVQRLTFLTFLTGSLAVTAGILGMNFKAEIFEAESGFWIAVGGLIAAAAGLTVLARYKRWI
ncbi:MAG TPA: CorA family divalent cation transporter [Pyrinomonadaceae bacterium]|nr:CorA family divalent cation transporter [Pyrinomonadaceae bacterium]